MTIGFAKEEAAFVASAPRSTTRFSAVMATAASTNPDPILRFTEADALLLGNQGAPLRHLTSVHATFLAVRAPNMSWIPMILQDVFPNDISYNSVGSIRFATDVTVVDSGDDQRTRRWDQPLQEFDISYGVRTMEQLQQLIAFFRAMRGRLYAFNYRDWLDYSSSMASAVEARAAPPISPHDQFQMHGDGSTYRFQLIKSYVAPRSGTTQVRPITRPEPDSTLVWWEGEHGGDWTDHFWVDNETGIVTLQARHGLSGLTVTKDAGSTGTAVAIRAAPGTFWSYRQFASAHRKVIVSGFHNAENNVALDQVATVEGVSDDDSTLILAYGQGGASADSSTNFSVAIHPAPPVGYTVTAGFQFFVPVRFDTDTLSTTLEDYGVGSSNSIKLIEVRPTAF